MAVNDRGVKWDQIFLGVGSDEAIDMIMRIFCAPGKDAILITPPTYGMYTVCAKVKDRWCKIGISCSASVDAYVLKELHSSDASLFPCKEAHAIAWG